MAAPPELGRVHAALRRAASHLAEDGVPWALVGGIAVGARGFLRFTHDVDVALAPRDDRAAEAVVHGFVRRGYSVASVFENITTGQLATVRLLPPEGDEADLRVDLLFRASGVEAEVVAQATEVEVLRNLRLPVATRGHLLAMKVVARQSRKRALDLQDIRGLLVKASGEDLEMALAALELARSRGFDHTGNLLAAWRRLLARYRPMPRRR